LKTILTYPEEGWTKVQNKVSGIVFRYDPDDDKYTRIKDVPEKDILLKIDGCWKEQIYCWLSSGKESRLDKFKGNGDAKKQLLVDVTPMMPVPKICPPPEEQLPNESRKFWQELTTAIQEKRFGDANRIKQTIEQNQRDKTAERKTNGQEWKVRFFTEATESGGEPHLSEEGKAAIAGMQKREFHLKENEMVGA
jgi:oxysterol-binding protein-related protein 9/10/11